MTLIKVSKAREILQAEHAEIGKYSHYPADVVANMLSNIDKRLQDSTLHEAPAQADLIPPPLLPSDLNHPANATAGGEHHYEGNAQQKDFSNRDSWRLAPEHVKQVDDLLDCIKSNSFILSLRSYLAKNSYLTPRQASKALKNIKDELDFADFGENDESAYALLETMEGREG